MLRKKELIYLHGQQLSLWLTGYSTRFDYYSAMPTEQSRTSPASDSAAETGQCRAAPAGSAPAVSRLVLQHLQAALLPPGSLPPVAADLQAAQKLKS